MQKAISTALILAAGIAIGAFWGWTVRILSQGVSGSLLVQCLAVVITVWVTVWNFRKAKEKEIEARQFPQKAEIYEGLIKQFKELHVATQEGREFDQEALAQALLDIQFKAIVWGDEELIDALAEMSQPLEDGGQSEIFDRMARLYQQMRRELGHKDRKGFGWDILALFVTHADRPMMRVLKARSLAGRRFTVPPVPPADGPPSA